MRMSCRTRLAERANSAITSLRRCPVPSRTCCSCLPAAKSSRVIDCVVHCMVALTFSPHCKPDASAPKAVRVGRKFPVLAKAHTQAIHMLSARRALEKPRKRAICGLQPRHSSRRVEQQLRKLGVNTPRHITQFAWYSLSAVNRSATTREHAAPHFIADRNLRSGSIGTISRTNRVVYV